MADNNEWGSNLSFLLAMIGSAVGLGNIWRYPYVLYESGGGVFFIPYLIAIFLLGIPFLILEYAVGYNFKASFSKGLRKIHKRFEFLGWVLPLSTFTIMIYYAAVVGWIAVYVILSFYKGWGDEPGNFFGNTLLRSDESPKGLGTFAPYVTLSMALCWILIWFISHKQLEKGLGIVNKILVPLLFIIMIVIVIYSLCLEGASYGLKVLFTPDWSKLYDFNVWMNAFGQIIFSISLGLSMAYTYAGYARKNTDLITNAVVMITANCTFENFCALGVFSILGYMAKVENIDLTNKENVSQSAGLVFIAYPKVMNILGNLGYVVGPAFFITVFLACLTSILSMIEPLSFCIQNKFNWTRKRTMSVLIVVGAILSLLFSTGYGSTLLDYVDKYINNILILFCIIIECFIFAWVFRARRAIQPLNERSKTLKVGTWWIVIVKYILPIFTVVTMEFRVITIIISKCQCIW